MSRIMKVLSLVLVLCFALTAFYGCGSSNQDTKDTSTALAASNSTEGEGTGTEPVKITRTLKIRAVIDPMYSATFRNDPVTDDTLVKLINEKIAEKTGGVAVEVEWIIPPPDTTRDQYLNMIISSGDIPEVLAMNDLANDVTSLKLVASKDIVYEMSEDVVSKNMPDYTARISEYGGTLKDVLDANKYESKNLYLPQGLNPVSFPNVAQDILLDGTYYGLYLRDDILKQIFPNAKSEAELKQLLLQNGDLTPQDVVGDIPIKSMDDLYSYMNKVKDLNLKVGEKPVIPGNIFSSSEMPDSTLWSLSTVTGNKWNWPLMYGDNLENSYYAYASEEYKTYTKWLNKFYNDKLIDPETFVMKDDQVRAKVTNGEYAIINAFGPVADARTTGLERGYGYRYLPVFYPLDQSRNANNIIFVNQKVRGPLLTKTIKDEDLSIVMNWLDFYMSEEYDKIRCWGSPDWYTGEGKDRSYKPEYKNIENWVLYGEASEKDGQYYHMSPSEPLGYTADIKGDPIVRPQNISFFAGGLATYPDGPFYVIPKDKSKLASVEVGSYCQKVMYKDAQKNIKRYRQIGWSEAVDLYTPKMTELEKNFWGNTKFTSAIAKLVVGKEQSFDANWADYMKVFDSYGRVEAEKEASAVLADKFKNSSVEIK